ncbi:MAG: DUF1800 domain-containing protein [Proteobacteria bacterium]|nr:DUF1800 domain-containing protein [Pseudomonadota bacterium]MBI3499304.1 DUF1800 domain-containing protein [Pseudomonadota bacterium]
MPVATAPTAPPPAAAWAQLNRLAFGPRAGEAELMHRQGLAAWLDQQLKPDEAADGESRKRLAAATLRIRYPAGDQYPAVDETRPLGTLAAPIEQVWPLADGKRPIAGAERQRPRQEVMAATLIRAVYSRWQLREVLVDFWHNHFNVNAAGDQSVAAALPSFDRDAIRPHALGNFRQLLGAVAKSPAMLVYLNNRSSRAGNANENYARELFELHGLGRAAYFNDLYSRWRDVPGAADGHAAGYIDGDVYEAARAFTGWSIEDGAGLGGELRLPMTGRFVYVEAWHDNYQKRVLASEFDPFQPAMADGERVLDLVAFHPATARHVATKLCQRLVADAPPPGLVQAAADRFIKLRDRPDQIAQTVRLIATSPDIARGAGAKVKRPLELVASFMRASGIDFQPTLGLLGELDGSGQRLFGWGPPTGHPDTADYWTSTSAMRRRWSLVLGTAENWWSTGVFDPTHAVGGGEVAAASVLGYWLPLLTGTHEGAEDLAAAMGVEPMTVLATDQARRLVALAALSPRFQRR